MFVNLIRYKGTDKSIVIRTTEPIVLERSNDTEFISIVDNSTGEVTQFRPVDVLSIGTVNEANIPKSHQKTNKAQPKEMKIE